MISTFYGAFGAFYDQYEKKIKSSPECVFAMHWSKHPDKRKGLYTSKPVGKEYVLEILDTEYPFDRDADGNITYKFILDGKLRSVYRDWYEREKSGSIKKPRSSWTWRRRPPAGNSCRACCATHWR